MTPDEKSAPKEPTNRKEARCYWLSHVKSCDQSGKKRAAYCKLHNITYHRFKYWYYKIHAESQAPSLKSIPVHLSAPENNGPLCTLCLSSGHELKIHDKAALSLLLKKIL